MRLLVTGGCGFIGSSFVRYILEHYEPEFVTNVDALTYAGNIQNVAGLAAQYGERYEFFHADIANADLMDELLKKHRFFAVINFAAESHVDRSINSPQNFVHTNVSGTSVLLDAARRHGVRRFVQISTDEVYGSAAPDARLTEESPTAPISLYAASKASADQLALAFHKTFGSDVMVTRCSNTYGPGQHPEKFVPLMITNAVRERRLPVHGDGQNMRNWIFVEDHCAAIVAVLLNGKGGEIYNVGSDSEVTNLNLAQRILDHMGKPRDLVELVPDEIGHARRYVIDSSKIRAELGWKPLKTIEKALPGTIDWYLANRDWWEKLAP